MCVDMYNFVYCNDYDNDVFDDSPRIFRPLSEDFRKVFKKLSDRYTNGIFQ